MLSMPRTTFSRIPARVQTRSGAGSAGASYQEQAKALARVVQDELNSLKWVSLV